MAIYMPPLARKKRVDNRYNPDSFRVISHHAEETHPKYESNDPYFPPPHRLHGGLALPNIYNRKTEVLPVRPAPDYRAHKPHPGSCGFLRSNVRLLNEPICSVYTEYTKEEQQQWWPSRVSNEPLDVPPKTLDTIYRGDFQPLERTSTSFGSMRHTANPNTEPALGTVPVNFLKPREGKQRLFQEKMSYEHQYNCRSARNYPIRGKRQGTFVWDKMSPEATQKAMDYYKVISAEEGAVKQQQKEACSPPPEPQQTPVKVDPAEMPKTEVKQPSPPQSAKPSPPLSATGKEEAPTAGPSSTNGKPSSPKPASAGQPPQKPEEVSAPQDAPADAPPVQQEAA